MVFLAALLAVADPVLDRLVLLRDHTEEAHRAVALRDVVLHEPLDVLGCFRLSQESREGDAVEAVLAHPERGAPAQGLNAPFEDQDATTDESAALLVPGPAEVRVLLARVCPCGHVFLSLFGRCAPTRG